jgi:hypothetical protein
VQKKALYHFKFEKRPAEVVYQMPEIGFGVRFTGGDESEMQRLRWLVKAELLRAREY